MAGTSKALVQRSFKEPVKQLALRKKLGYKLTQVTTKIRSSDKSILRVPMIETTHHNIFSQDMDILGALPPLHSLM
jgi:hypothetical protein